MPEDVTDRRCCHKCNMTVTGRRKLSKCAQCHSITYCSRKCQREDWPRHSQFCIPVMVSEIPGKGKGLVASKDFKKGEVIFEEAAAIAIYSPAYVVPLQELKDQISQLSTEQKTKFYQLSPRGNFNEAQLASAFMEDCLQELDIFVSNSMELSVADGILQLCITPRLLNHSCTPNAFKEKCGDDSSYAVQVIAIKDISKGEEVTECYKRGFMTRSQMKTTLQEDFSFDCKCSVCSGSIPNQDKIISKIQKQVSSPMKLELESMMNHMAQTLRRFEQMKRKDWLTEASKFERVADLSKQLYIGHFEDKLFVIGQFVSASQMARDPVRLKKATDVLEEEISAFELMKSAKNYRELKTTLATWSGEFKSKKNPTGEEIRAFYFYFMPKYQIYTH